MPERDGRDEQPAQGSAGEPAPHSTSPYFARTQSPSAPTPAAEPSEGDQAVHEPVTTEPTTAEQITAEQITVDQVVGEPANTEPLDAEPEGEHPTVAEPANAEPANAELPATASAPESPAPSAPTPEEAETQVLDPVQNRPTEVMEEVLVRDPSPAAPPWVPASASAETDEDDGVVGDGDSPHPSEPAPADRNWVGVAAFVTGALLLSVIAIVLGHVGLAAAKKGRANNQAFSIAGLVLGYLGLVLTVVGAWLLLADPASRQDVDLQAQQDVSAVGAAAATLAVETGELPDIEQVAEGYRVGGDTLEANLTEYGSLEIAGSTATDWCLSIAYAEGEQQAFHYVATSGMAPGPCPDGD